MRVTVMRIMGDYTRDADAPAVPSAGGAPERMVAEQPSESGKMLRGINSDEIILIVDQDDGAFELIGARR